MPEKPLPSRIISYPDPRLRQDCKPIKVFDETVATLVARMQELMTTGNGVGLAGPQVGVCRRIFVCNPTGEPEGAQVYINPEIVDLAGAAEAEEGCLSLPDIRVMVKRARKCVIRAQDVNGETFERSAEGLLARIWQHETDHLNGKLIIDRMDTTDRIANRKKIGELEAKFEKSQSRKKAKSARASG